LFFMLIIPLFKIGKAVQDWLCSHYQYKRNK
jgi:hypothetical protein